MLSDCAAADDIKNVVQTLQELQSLKVSTNPKSMFPELANKLNKQPELSTWHESERRKSAAI